MEKILVVVDMQNDFITGSLGTKEAQMIVPDVAMKIEAYHQAHQKVIFTQDTHTEAYMNTSEGKKLPVIHCVKDSWGWALEERISQLVADQDVVLTKPTFGSIALGEMIQKIADNQEGLQVELVGLCTDICVISNALLIKAYAPEVQIKVAGSCCAGVTPESHENALRAMAMCQIEIDG